MIRLVWAWNRVELTAARGRSAWCIIRIATCKQGRRTSRQRFNDISRLCRSGRLNRCVGWLRCLAHYRGGAQAERPLQAKGLSKSVAACHRGMIAGWCRRRWGRLPCKPPALATVTSGPVRMQPRRSSCPQLPLYMQSTRVQWTRMSTGNIGAGRDHDGQTQRRPTIISTVMAWTDHPSSSPGRSVATCSQAAQAHLP